MEGGERVCQGSVGGYVEGGERVCWGVTHAYMSAGRYWGHN